MTPRKRETGRALDSCRERVGLVGVGLEGCLFGRMGALVGGRKKGFDWVLGPPGDRCRLRP